MSIEVLRPLGLSMDIDDMDRNKGRNRRIVVGQW